LDRSEQAPVGIYSLIPEDDRKIVHQETKMITVSPPIYGRSTLR
jgi:hypothetical protein